MCICAATCHGVVLQSTGLAADGWVLSRGWDGAGAAGVWVMASSGQILGGWKQAQCCRVSTVQTGPLPGKGLHLS
jgi:hypothetical protein